ncbi:probable flavin-containing monooxygenase 1 [Juglans microcarpa x Juglans regia]|uniref:probable flavin-containing monooxygenase 1 n=1 Tax=Juglans microcarpa x Juglans regia TaxID=2249226 RepID=UPI001B7DAE56|nr:probable flavin-containing monooxygenase 1 [Juglans microcarpa x Juglans regia]
MEKRVAIIGAGTSGLLACKYMLQKGFNTTVFEAKESVGGLWTHTIESTKLQNAKETYQFSDFPWPSSVQEVFPTHTQVLRYLESYAQHFGIIPYIKFNSKVINIDYVGESYEEMESWDHWGGTGKPFGSRGKWHILVQDTKSCSTEVYQFEFVVLCIGRFSGLPNIPEFPPDQGPEVFNGKVIHSMDYSDMDKVSAAELIRRKRIAVVGSLKSAIDIAAECANANGVEYPCTLIQRTAHWFLPSGSLWGVSLGFLCFSRFSELLVHKPGETFPYKFLATMLSPLRWGVSKFAESYLRWKSPLKKYGVIPKHSFLQDFSSCRIGMLPEKFYDKVDEGSLVLKKSQSFSFYKEGLIINGEEPQQLKADLVILATGYKGDQKLKNMFESQIFRKYIVGSATSIVPLYRQIIHPRIPQVAVIGYAESYFNLGTSEIRCQWLAHFLDGNLELPRIRDTEKEIILWENNIKQYDGRYFRNTGIASSNIWYNDQLCKDMGCKHKRKKGIFAEYFQPYGPLDYAGLLSK